MGNRTGQVAPLAEGFKDYEQSAGLFFGPTSEMALDVSCENKCADRYCGKTS